MHATLSVPQFSPVSALLSGAARAVALYASDMPNTCRFYAVGEAQVEAWIAQGVERLGLAQVRADGAFLRSYNLDLIGCGYGPADEDAYRRRFPSVRRISRAQSVAGALALEQGDRDSAAPLADVIPFPSAA
ncbi:hypothetical protein ACFV6F_02425 [Kitasatospora phosalacinea]|uniref:hypothetical protein n=1 Tax=Kitasatospora phosalacinea TaxID=2065 RepID=UPI00364EB7BC